jgi:hypothetical protein
MPGAFPRLLRRGTYRTVSPGQFARINPGVTRLARVGCRYLVPAADLPSSSDAT